MFLGYCTKSVFGLQKVCAEHGVRLDTYPARFAKIHARLLRITDQVVDTKSWMDLAKTSGTTSAQQHLERLAAVRTTDVPGVCRWMEANGEKLAEGAHFAKVMPDFYATLARSE